MIKIKAVIDNNREQKINRKKINEAKTWNF